MKWKLGLMFVLVHIEYGTPQSHSRRTPAKGDNKDLAEGEDKNYPSRLEELANSRRQALPMDEWPDAYAYLKSRIPTTDSDQGQGVRPKVGPPPGFFEQNEPWAKELAKEKTGLPYSPTYLIPVERPIPLNFKLKRPRPGGNGWQTNQITTQNQNLPNKPRGLPRGLGIVSTRPESPTFIQDRDLAKPPIPVIRPRPVVRQNPVSGQKPVATGGNGWQTNQITTQYQNLPNIPRVNLHNLPNLPANPARPQHNALRSRSLSTIPEVLQQRWQPQSPVQSFSLFNRNDARSARLQPQSAILRNGEQKPSQIYAQFLLEQARAQARARARAGTLPILNRVPDVFETWRNRRKRPQTTE